MFIQTEDTPNPETLKFLPGKVVMPSGTVDFPNSQSAQRSPLAQNIFKTQGIQRVFFGHNFISVTKETNIDWPTLKPMVLGKIMEHFMVHDSVQVQEEISEQVELSDIEKEIKELIETRIRPAVAMDGGDIVFHQFKDGIVTLEMRGACSNCPSSTATLKSGIENMLKHYIPEVQEVCAL
ncbi:MAG: NifU family protein [Janthinobacterium lividum]